MIELSAPADLDLDGYRRIVGGEAVAVASDAYTRVAEAREALEHHLEGAGNAYGITTGLGYLTSVAVGAADQAALQRSLVTARASGLGAPLPADVVRGAITIRLAGFLSGHAGVTPGLCRFIVDRLNDGWEPVVPDGPYGAAGEIGPLAHLFQTIVGEGLVADGDEVLPAAEALARQGLTAYELQPKEGLALVNGSPFATALAVHLGELGFRLLRQAGCAAALAIGVVGASTRPFSPRVAGLWQDPAATRVAAELIEMLAGGPLWENQLQAPVSTRVVPQVHGLLLARLDELEHHAALGLRAVTDSPLLLPAGADEPAGLYPSGAFHAAGTTVLLESVAIAVAHVTNLVEKRLHRLLDSRFSGLPEQLARVPGRQAGAVSLHKTVVALATENRLLAAPASVHATDTSSGQEDVQMFTFLVAERLRHALENLETALACELTALRHAAALRPDPLAAPGLAAMIAALADVVPPLEEDRTLSPEVERVRSLLQTGAFAGR
jgi:histidine ammonia-lyase